MDSRFLLRQQALDSGERQTNGASSGKDLADGQSGERWLARSSLGSAGNRGMQGAAAASIMIAGAWFAWLCTLSRSEVRVSRHYMYYSVDC